MLVLIQMFAASAHPADGPGRIAESQGMVGDVPGNHGPRADKGLASDGHPADNGRIGSDGRPLLDAGGTNLIHFTDFSPGVVDVGKDHGWTAENPILQGHTLIDAYVVLNLAVVADLYTSRQTRFVQSVILNLTCLKYCRRLSAKSPGVPQFPSF